VTRRANTVKSGRILKVVSSLVAIAIAIGGPAACSEPQVRCAAQDGEAIAYYKLLSTSGSCTSSSLPQTAGSDPSLFPLGVESYVPTPSDPNSGNEVGSIALQPEWLGARIEDAQLNAATDPSLASSQAVLANYPYGTGAAPAPPPNGAPSTNFPYAWGKFDTVFPDADGICKVSSLTVSHIVYPEIPAHIATNAVGSPLGSPTYATATAGASVTVPPATTCTVPNAGTVCTTGGPCINGLCTTPCTQDSDCPSDQACTAIGTDNICEVPDQPQTDVSYTWSNVRVYVTPSKIGLQTFGNLTVVQDGCTVKYSVSILVPRVLCANANNPANAETTLCNADADGIDNPFGSGISEGIQTTCSNLGNSDNPDWECLPQSPDQDPLAQLP
jgi:hypothetical protein